MARCLDSALLSSTDLACCPTPGCNYLFPWDREHRKLDCPKCRNAFCLLCKGAMEQRKHAKRSS